MEKSMAFIGKFYLKNGTVIEERVEFEEDSNKEDVISFVEDIRANIKRAFKENENFHIAFGMTMFRGSELVAVTITEDK